MQASFRKIGLAGYFYLFTYFGFDPPFVETAEGESEFPTQLGTFDFNIGEDDFTWELTSDASAYGFGGDSFVFNNRAGDILNNPGGSLDALITRHFDFTDITGAALYFMLHMLVLMPFKMIH